MAATPNLTALYGELNKFIHVSDYKQALKAANKIIHTKEGKEDVEAMHCKVVCMIQMSHFADALKFIETTPEIQELLIFEKAYCQYRLLKTDEALETLKYVKNPDIRTLELKAQVLYKLGNYQESLKIYKQLMKECTDDYEEERMTNLSAVHAALSAFENVETEIGFKVESYEQLYNKACWLLGRNRVEEAQKILEDAETACREVFADDPDMTEEDVEAEVSVIKVQLAYAMQLQGKLDEALVIYNQVIRSRPTDLGLVAVASNNIISINKDQNVFDSRKKMKATVAAGVENKLVPVQRKKIDFNRALLFMYSNQWEACRKLLKMMQREYQDSDIPCLIQAAQLCREKNANKAIEYLKSYITEHSDPDLSPKFDFTNIKLALIQLLLGQGELQQACDQIESLGEMCFTPGMVSCLVALHNAQAHDAQNAINVFTRAIEWHKSNKSSQATLTNLMWECSQFCLDHHKPKDAAEVLEAILRIDPKNVKVLAKLIYSYSQFNTSKAHQLSDDLPSLAELSVTVDVDELERNASRLAPRYVKKQKEKKEANESAPTQTKTGVVSEGSTNVDLKKIKKKKKKKNPAPKNFIAGYTADPERWLPLRERSYYKGRRKDRRKGGVGKGTQGSHFGSSDNYDMSHKPASATAQAPNSPKPGSDASGSQGNTPISSPKPTQVRGKKPINKKKKKGKGGW
uniref:Signal recognition particle subunit SRP72 n=1 Tax=Phallusia mammillata TaxID=59560 RepID=A0A6F9DT13_9ASCI|nr:signal recognition particle subunit SRP72-like [Phallusia mammillata]